RWLCIWLSDQTLEDLEKMARREGLSKSEMINVALQHYK
nr:Chain A, Designed protein [synthetic construct]2MDV_B Chain B, Designed protein [synthetic construct]